MTNKTIPDAPAASSVGASDLLWVWQNSALKKATAAQVNEARGTYINVLDKGADPTGAADSTAAFNAALAAGPTIVPPGIYLVGNVAMPNRGILMGTAVLGYTSDTPATGSKPVLKAKAGSTSIVNVFGTQYWQMSGIAMDGNGVSGIQGVSDGGGFATMRDLTVSNCDFGIGSDSNTSGPYYIWDCQVQNCGTAGISGLNDSAMFGGALTANTFGMKLWGGSTNLIGVRVEWNTSCGVFLNNGTQSSASQIVGGLFDANGDVGIRSYLTGAITITGVMFRRNGRNLGANNCHIRLEGATKVVISGCYTQTGVNDGGGGSPSPTNSVHFLGVANSEIIFAGNHLRGNVSGTWYTGTLPTVDLVVSGNLT